MFLKLKAKFGTPELDDCVIHCESHCPFLYLWCLAENSTKCLISKQREKEMSLKGSLKFN